MHKKPFPLRQWWPLLFASLLFFNWSHPNQSQADSLAMRKASARPLSWHKQGHHQRVFPLKILGINDFHSQITPGQQVAGRPVGSAPVLASYLKKAEAKAPGPTFILHAGDHVGASPLQSALLQDEPGITFFNMLGNKQCRPNGMYGKGCNLIGIPGNHELDEGMFEAQRLIHGGQHSQGPFLENPYLGADFPYICANLVRADTNLPVFLPYIVREVHGIQVGFIGAILHQLPAFVAPSSIKGLKVLDESNAINHYVRKLQAQGVHTIVVIMHQGGFQSAGDGHGHQGQLKGDITTLIKRLNPEVDVVFSGHTHTFHNILLANAGGGQTLVVQAWPKGTAYVDLELEISATTGDVVGASSRIVTTWADQGPGLQPDPQVTALMQRVEKRGTAMAREVIAHVAQPITRLINTAGESALGDLVADAQRQAMGTDFAFMHPEGISSDMQPGEITRGTTFTAYPANMNLIKLELTGEQIYELLNQQWQGTDEQGRFLQISGLRYTWDADKAPGKRIITVLRDGEPLDRNARYSVTVNEYLAHGGGHFSILTKGTHSEVGPFVSDALLQYVQTQPQPLSPRIDGRISRLN